MDVKKAIETRRAYRSLVPIKVTDALINDLATSAQLFCSCFNNQPWRYVFVYDPGILQQLHGVLSKGNEWVQAASMIIAVVSRPDLDCQIKGRNYYQFDTGMATAAVILRATELGLVAHPIAGFSPKKTRPILNIPESMEVIALVIVGKKAGAIDPRLSHDQAKAEQTRPERKPLDQLAFHNVYPAERRDNAEIQE